MNMDNNTISCSVELIGILTDVRAKYNILINYLINNATLNYNKTELNFSGIEEIVKALEFEKYDAKFDKLKEKELNKEDF
jgi:hypothetical protein